MNQGYSGSQAHLAVDAGVSSSLVSRVLNGRQNPPLELLESVARKPGISLRWLITGVGQMLKNEEPDFFLPRSSQLLPGQVDRHYDLCNGVIPVTKNSFRPTRYFFVVSKSQRIGDLVLKRGDTLLIETDVEICKAPQKNQILVVLDPDTRDPQLTAGATSSGLPPLPIGGRHTRNVNLRNSGTQGEAEVPSELEESEVPRELKEVVGVCISFERKWD